MALTAFCVLDPTFIPVNLDFHKVTQILSTHLLEEGKTYFGDYLPKETLATRIAKVEENCPTYSSIIAILKKCLALVAADRLSAKDAANQLEGLLPPGDLTPK
jgi:hypothetical protein